MKIESPALALPGIRHGFFTRHGGVSEGIYGSLNIGLGSRDDPARVAENRGRVADAMEVPRDRLVTPWQSHSAVTLNVERPWTDDDRPDADAVVTRVPGLAIGISTADCTPVLFADPDARIVGAAHAGWRGALGGVLESAVDAMEGLGAHRDRIIAVIGPTISQDNYEVGHDFMQTFIDADPANARWFEMPAGKDRPHFNLPAYAAARLRSAEVGTVIDLGLCTYGEEDRFFSFRRTTHREESDYGRLISAIALD
ncbi:peptidoglycan editing factor PgeF [Microbaculum marinum]|uniref:Purine nucleoside phosphorylase n=1 Tax=Microbaculum marinum TaxID=1764581 RepID=A0AAW9RXL5_9HYPH